MDLKAAPSSVQITAETSDIVSSAQQHVEPHHNINNQTQQQASSDDSGSEQCDSFSNATSDSGHHTDDSAVAEREKVLNEELVYLRRKCAEQTQLIANQAQQLDTTQRSCAELAEGRTALGHQLDDARKMFDHARKEKDSMVVKYAVSEKQVIDVKAAQSSVEKKNKEYLKEIELLQGKLRTMESEKSRIGSMYDNKCYDWKTSQHEVDRLKTDLGALETKLKWSHNSLKTEMELRKQSDAKVDNLSSKIQEYVDNSERAKKEAQEQIREFRTSQENRAYVLEQQVQEYQAKMILLRHERDDRDAQLRRCQSDLEKSQAQYAIVLDENNKLSLRVQTLERDRSEIELRCSELSVSLNQQKQETCDLNAANMHIQSLQTQLENAERQLAEANKQIAVLKQSNADIESSIEGCRNREAELLIFTQQLTEKNVKLQSEFTSMDTKVQQLTCEQLLLKRTAKEHEANSTILSSQLMELRIKTAEEVERLQLQLVDADQLAEKMSQEVANQKGENSVIRRKLELSLREVTKELNNCRKQLEKFEQAGLASSSSSSTSLNNIESTDSSQQVLRSNQDDHITIIQPDRIVDRQALIEHIVKLQRISARKSEKLDFLEEHVNTLVAELQRKTRLLQNYILREKAGTLSSNKMDSNKASLVKHGGVMASMYGSRITEPTMTLELSMDINRKLQAVLEDALLKNITLKGNVDTLGQEIDRLNNELSSTS